MTNAEKQLLLKDLCARLPYGIKLGFKDSNLILCPKEFNIYVMQLSTLQVYPKSDNMVIEHIYDVWNYRPYLRPMSSMTEEELNECVRQSGIKDIECPNWQDVPKEKQFEARLNYSIAVFLTDSNNVDWLNKHHFDYRGLIPMGLALEAPKDMYKTE